MADTKTLMQSRLFAMGIAVSDLEVSAAFYRDVLGLDEVNRISLPNMEEVVLQYPGADHKVVLMKFTDGKDRNVTRLPVKLVFPRVLCFLPGIFIWTLGPALYEFIRLADSVLRQGG